MPSVASSCSNGDLQLGKFFWIREVSPVVILEPKPNQAPQPDDIIWFEKPRQNQSKVHCGMGDWTIEVLPVAKVEEKLLKRGVTMSAALRGDY